MIIRWKGAVPTVSAAALGGLVGAVGPSNLVEFTTRLSATLAPALFALGDSMIALKKAVREWWDWRAFRGKEVLTADWVGETQQRMNCPILCFNLPS